MRRLALSVAILAIASACKRTALPQAKVKDEVFVDASGSSFALIAKGDAFEVRPCPADFVATDNISPEGLAQGCPTGGEATTVDRRELEYAFNAVLSMPIRPLPEIDQDALKAEIDTAKARESVSNLRVRVANLEDILASGEQAQSETLTKLRAARAKLEDALVKGVPDEDGTEKLISEAIQKIIDSKKVTVATPQSASKVTWAALKIIVSSHFPEPLPEFVNACKAIEDGSASKSTAYTVKWFMQETKESVCNGAARRARSVFSLKLPSDVETFDFAVFGAKGAPYLEVPTQDFEMSGLSPNSVSSATSKGCPPGLIRTAATWTNLDMLRLADCNPSSQFPTSGFPQLYWLSLDGSGVPALAGLASAPKLSSLSLPGQSLGQAVANGLNMLRGIKTLYISCPKGTSLDQAGFDAMGLVLSPEGIYFSGCGVGAEKLTPFKNLIYLSLFAANIGDPEVARIITALPNLKELDLRYNKISDLTALERMPNLARFQFFKGPTTKMPAGFIADSSNTIFERSRPR